MNKEKLPVPVAVLKCQCLSTKQSVKAYKILKYVITAKPVFISPMCALIEKMVNLNKSKKGSIKFATKSS